MTESFKLKLEMVDAFVLLATTTRKRDCAYAGCKRAGRVRVFYREQPTENQQATGVCVQHAFELANQLLGKYKFNQ